MQVGPRAPTGSHTLTPFGLMTARRVSNPKVGSRPCNSLWTGSDGIALKEQVSAVAAALCRLGYHGLCSIRGAHVYK
jgi:hypothetical protein